MVLLIVLLMVSPMVLPMYGAEPAVYLSFVGPRNVCFFSSALDGADDDDDVSVFVHCVPADDGSTLNAFN